MIMSCFLKVADYYDHIKYPMDLKTMSERLKANYYCNKRLFIADFKRMFANCRAYNSPDTEYYNCAVILQKYVNAKLRDHGLIEKWRQNFVFGKMEWTIPSIKIIIFLFKKIIVCHEWNLRKLDFARKGNNNLEVICKNYFFILIKSKYS